MARILAAEHESALGTAGRRTTLEIILGDGTPLYLSTADTLIEETLYLGKLDPVDDLNLDATQATEGINLRISNITLDFGQSLINTPDILSGTQAFLGAYFVDEDSSGEWHDVKLEGKITVGEITGDWVNVFFESTVSSKIYNGARIEQFFPDAEIPAEELPQSPQAPAPVFNDLSNAPTDRNSGMVSKISPLLGDYQLENGRYSLPEFPEFEGVPDFLR